MINYYYYKIVDSENSEFNIETVEKRITDFDECNLFMGYGKIWHSNENNKRNKLIN